MENESRRVKRRGGGEEIGEVGGRGERKRR